mmetsp:Transcript_26842/g.70478  ORF Transcript_26842/g.70478 Transcript_26842/m.70478 type:complete len:384 (-) Transcript_26842:544-1695(-)
MMMLSNTPSPAGPSFGRPDMHKSDDLASVSKMISLPTGIDRPLCSDSSFRNQSTFCSDPTAGVTGGSPEYWRRLDDALSEGSSDEWSNPSSPVEQTPPQQHFQPRVPTSIGTPVPITKVPIRQMTAGDTNNVNQHEKPPYSFPCLIGLALQSAPTGRMSVAQIYDYIMGHFPYFRTAKAGWKNSVRHNLSLNKFFCKLERREDEQGKGSMWGIVPKNKEQLIRDIQACRNRYPSKFRNFSTGHEADSNIQRITPGTRHAMPAAPAPKGVVNRARSSPMLLGGNSMIRQAPPLEEPRRLSLPAEIPEFDPTLDIFAGSFDSLPMMKTEVDAFLGVSEVCWIGGNGGSSNSGASDMEISDEWLPIPEDLSAYIGGGGDQWGNVFN